MAEKKKTDYKLAVGNRLETLRKHLRYDINTMASRMNITPWSYRQYKAGNHKPNISSLRSLVNEFKLSLDWLFFGKGNMFYRDVDGEISLAVKKAVETERTAQLAAETKRKEQEAKQKAAEEKRKNAEERKKAAEDEKNKQIALVLQNNPLYQELEELTHLVKWVPSVRYAIMAYFQKIKEDQKDAISKALEKADKKTT
ncbi:MAG: helix-turn-helix domain-containing protein [bacterium]|nr:helix-turn-helix domain-containing protein [bacterium]